MWQLDTQNLNNLYSQMGVNKSVNNWEPYNTPENAAQHTWYSNLYGQGLNPLTGQTRGANENLPLPAGLQAQMGLTPAKAPARQARAPTLNSALGTAINPVGKTFGRTGQELNPTTYANRWSSYGNGQNQNFSTLSNLFREQRSSGYMR
jgi:hypothetical protein